MSSCKPEFYPTRNYICVYDFDSIIFAGVSILQKDFIYAIHKETETEKKFDNISKFRGVGVDSRPGGIGGQFIDRKTKIKQNSWLLETNNELITKGKQPYLVSDFIIEKRPEVVNDDVAAKYFINNTIAKLLEISWVNKRNLKLVIGNESGSNYRKDIAFSKPYKAGRGPKPLRFSAIREWFVSKYNDNVVSIENAEADDALTIFGTWANENNKDVVLIYSDKDIRQQKNHWYFDYRRISDVDKEDVAFMNLEPIWIDEFTAANSFWVQMVKGDSCDKISGLPTRADVFCDHIFEGATTEKDLAVAVLVSYANYYIEKPYVDSYGKQRTVIDMLQEQYQLLRLMEKRDVIPCIIDKFDKLGIDYNSVIDKVAQEINSIDINEMS